MLTPLQREILSAASHQPESLKALWKRLPQRGYWSSFWNSANSLWKRGLLAAHGKVYPVSATVLLQEWDVSRTPEGDAALEEKPTDRQETLF